MSEATKPKLEMVGGPLDGALCDGDCRDEPIYYPACDIVHLYCAEPDCSGRIVWRYQGATAREGSE